MGGGGGSRGGSGGGGSNSRPAQMDQGPSAMAPGRGGTGGWQGGPATVMIIGGSQAVTNLTRVISNGVQYGGNRLVASHNDGGSRL